MNFAKLRPAARLLLIIATGLFLMYGCGVGLWEVVISFAVIGWAYRYFSARRSRKSLSPSVATGAHSAS